ncbi:hypothetical protein GQR58_028198 [Nymphon striatum]|nr:hypothetical protein GQR58_028198 [Nymphon striatum]
MIFLVGVPYFGFLLSMVLPLWLYAMIVARESLPKEKRNSIRIQEVSRVYLRTLQTPRYLRLVFILALAFASFLFLWLGRQHYLFDVLDLEANSFYILFVPMVMGIMLGASSFATLGAFALFLVWAGVLICCRYPPNRTHNSAVTTLLSDDLDTSLNTWVNSSANTFFAMDRERLPFNRAQRSWVYRGR